jgi:alkylhydroperoxidase family enzyme
VIENMQKRFGDRDPASTGESTGSWWGVLALDERLCELVLDRHAWQFGAERKLPARLREFALARTGWVCESAFVFSQHCKVLQRLGEPDAKIAAIPAWASEQCWSDAERVILAYTDGVASGGRVDDQTFAALRSQLNDIQILELTYMVCTYISSATLCRALRLELDDRSDPVRDAWAPASPTTH